MTKVELYAIGTSTTLASNKSLRRNHITGCEFQIPQNLRRLINVYASNFMP